MISLRCSVIDATDPGRCVDLDVRAPDGATVADAVPALCREAALPPASVLAVDGERLRDHALLGRPPLLDGVLLVAHRSDVPAARRAAGLLRLAVVSGPDAGHELPLRPGSHTVGRDLGASLVLDDPDLSRHHVRVLVNARGVTVHDLGSTNGSWVDRGGGATSVRVPVAAEGLPLQPGDRLGAGGSVLVLRGPRATPATTFPDGVGGLELVRGPRRSRAVAAVELERPVEPAAAGGSRLPWIAMVAPLVLSVGMALVLRQPTYLAFGLMTPVMMLASAWSDRRGRRADDRRARERYEADDAAARERVDAACSAELTRRRQLAGDAAELRACALTRSARLWERGAADDDVLDVLLGRARQPSSVSVRTGGAVETPELDDAPAVLRWPASGHLGVHGRRERVEAIVRFVVAQLACRASPSAVRLAVVGDAAGWGWTRWLPHATGLSAADVESQVRRRLEQRATARLGEEPRQAWPRLVVVAVGEAGEVARQLPTTLERGASVGVLVVVTADRAADLPPACSALLDVPERGRARLRTPVAEEPLEVHPDGVGAGWCEEVARALAPLRDVTGDVDGTGDLPPSVALRDVLEVDPHDAAAVRAGWERRPRSTTAVIGAGADGPAAVDLVRDGPHALVAGTTGSGKSELLQTLVTSLAVSNRPDELAFVLVDYKGGAAFRGCAGLPHVAGLVTDLDEHLASRALSALQAELTRRERLLADVGAADLREYQRWCDADDDLPRLARLVVVIDEFRLLATELPQFLDGLVRLAAVGRSLGVHLVLATQRPGGIVSADIRANVNLRVCLRVRDASDSCDVIDVADAARLPAALPGRALARTGSGTLSAFQVALAGGVPQPVPPDGVEVARAGALPPARTRAGDGLDRLVHAVRTAATDLGAVPPASPWLPPLPTRLLAHEVPAVLGAICGTDVPGLPLGLLDLPGEGRQAPLLWQDGDGHLAVSGAARTGRTSALLQVALAAVARFVHAGGPSCHVHVVDGAGGRLAAALAGLPHVGSALTTDHPRLVSRLLERLATTGRAGGDAHRTLLLVDGWDAVVEALDRLDHGRSVDTLLALARDGEGAGLRLVVAGGRGVLASRVNAVVRHRLLLRPNDPTDLVLAGLGPGDRLPTQQPPGRCVVVPGGREAQLVWPGEPDDVRDRLDELSGVIVASTGGRAVGEPVRVSPLPRAVPLAAVESVAEGGGRRPRVAIGLGGDDSTVVGLHLESHRLVVVAGPPGSGRSTALRLIGQQLLGRGRPVHVVTRDAGLDAAELLPGGLPVAARAADVRALAGRGGAVLVDDADLLGDADVVEALLSLTSGRDGPTVVTTVVTAVTTQHLAGSWTGLAAAVRRERTGLLLDPASAQDGEPFGLRAEPPDERTPGRGLLVVRGAAVPVQVALPPPAPAAELAESTGGVRRVALPR